MNFLALQLFDEESKQPLRVSVNPHYIVTAMMFHTGDEYAVKYDHGDGTHSFKTEQGVSVTLELHHENIIEMLMTDEMAKLLLSTMHTHNMDGSDILFKDLRNHIEPDDEE